MRGSAKRSPFGFAPTLTYKLSTALFRLSSNRLGARRANLRRTSFSWQPPGPHIRSRRFILRGPGGRPTLATVSAVPPNDSPGPVLFFDGECGLCQRLVRGLLRVDRAGRLRFASLQSPAAQVYLRRHGLPTQDFDTLVFVPDWSRGEEAEFLVRTAGVLAALRAIGGWSRAVAAVLAWVPAGLRDAAYRVVARTRYRIFGAWKPQPLARPEWAQRFLHRVE